MHHLDATATRARRDYFHERRNCCDASAYDRHMAMKTPKQSADRWNARYQCGARVKVTSYGVHLETTTASHAQQWGDLALLTLKGVPGLWTIAAIEPIEIDAPAVVG